ncbi:hypothetical protein HYU22_04155 [Candidatus Woesearchaeota archaeon]|nr:hypothetical protein [Candidatus Woesearchaeota archaeon]
MIIPSICNIYDERRSTASLPYDSDIYDHYDLYLVSRGVKPACDFALCYSGHKEQGEDSPEELEEKLASIQEWFDTFSLIYQRIPAPLTSHQMFRFGKDRQALQKLLEAQTDLEFGLAYGYPEEAVRAYSEGKVDAFTYRNALKAAVNSGKKLPLWLAYLNFVPDKFDVVNDDFSSSSREMGGNASAPG